MHFRRVRKDIGPLDRTWSKAHKKPMPPNLNFESRHPWQSEHSWELLGFTRTLLGFTRTMLGFTRTTRGFTRTTDLRVRHGVKTFSSSEMTETNNEADLTSRDVDLDQSCRMSILYFSNYWLAKSGVDTAESKLPIDKRIPPPSLSKQPSVTDAFVHNATWARWRGTRCSRRCSRTLLLSCVIRTWTTPRTSRSTGPRWCPGAASGALSRTWVLRKDPSRCHCSGGRNS